MAAPDHRVTPANWLAGPAPQVASTLLGAVLTHHSDKGVVSVALTEVEAYGGLGDPASHAWRGRTPRNRVMFGPAGFMYVYFSYGMHWCANVVTGPDGTAGAVLLRAGRVVAGHDLARERRGNQVAEQSLARGPACLTRALGIDRRHDGASLLGDGPLRLLPPACLVGGAPDARLGAVSAGSRVGVSRAADVAWRFWLSGDETVSTYRRSPRA